MRARLVMLLAVVALVAGACAGDDTDTAGETQAPTATEAPEETEAPDDTDGAMGRSMVAVASSDLGDIVVDGEGNTLYGFLPDDGGEPTCTGGCAETWPPFEGPAEAGEGADGALLDTAEHPSGVTQVTYNGWPLYFFANDEGPGDTNGQGVGDNWYVVSPAGEPIMNGS